MLNKLKFWLAQEERVKISTLPSAISNGFLIDFHADGMWDHFDPDRTVNTFPTTFTDCTRELHLVSEGKGGADKSDLYLYLYRYESCDGKHAFIQKQYAEYFRRLYLGCNFLAKDIAGWQDMAIAVMCQKKIIGAVCPVLSSVRYRFREVRRER